MNYNGLKCPLNTPKTDVFGMALEDASNTEQLQVWVGNISKYSLSNGEVGIGPDGRLSLSAFEKIGCIKNFYFYRY